MPSSLPVRCSSSSSSSLLMKVSALSHQMEVGRENDFGQKFTIQSPFHGHFEEFFSRGRQCPSFGCLLPTSHQLLSLVYTVSLPPDFGGKPACR